MTSRVAKASLADRRVGTGLLRITPRARVATVVAESAAAAWPTAPKSMATEMALASDDMKFP